MALRINAENFEEKVLKADKPVLVDFYSDTCIPCKQMACILGDLEDENEDALYIYKVNVNYDKALAEQYKVMSAPTVICFVNGEQKFNGDCQWGRKVEINVSDVNGDTDIAVIVNSTKADRNGGISKPIVITD